MSENVAERPAEDVERSGPDAGDEAANDRSDDETNGGVAQTAGGEGVCALEGCDNPLPPRGLTADGRRKGGRPPAYCCKAHADAASRARRAAQTAAIVDPLVEVGRIVERFDPTARTLVEALHEIQQRLAHAEEGALGRVRAAEEEAAAARREAASAERAAEKAEEARAKALAAAREDREARQQAERRADQAERAADEVRRRSWELVAEHERARGAAEAAQVAAERARDELAAELRAAHSQLAELQAAYRAAQREVADRDAALARAEAAQATLTGQLQASEARRAQLERDRDAVRDHLHSVQGELTAVRAELARVQEQVAKAQERVTEEHTARQVAEARVEALERELAALRQELAAAHARFDRLLANRHTPGDGASGESAPGGGTAERR
jgi:chromosome segregation ATPase